MIVIACVRFAMSIFMMVIQFVFTGTPTVIIVLTIISRGVRAAMIMFITMI